MKKSIAFFTALLLFVTADTLIAKTETYLHSSFAGKIDITGFGQTLTNSNDTIAASSTSNLTLPDGVTVKAAYLYWAGGWNSQDPASAIDETVVLTYDGSTSFPITSADETFTDDFGRLDTPVVDDSEEDYFGCFKDITTFVNSHKSGDYTLSGLDAWAGYPHSYEGTIFAGWAVYVIFEYGDISSEPLRVVNVYNGFELFYNRWGIDSVDLSPSNFVLPATEYCLI